MVPALLAMIVTTPSGQYLAANQEVRQLARHLAVATPQIHLHRALLQLQLQLARKLQEVTS